jgi:lysophospholipase L1-like esterase
MRIPPLVWLLGLSGAAVALNASRARRRTGARSILLVGDSHWAARWALGGQLQNFLKTQGHTVNRLAMYGKGVIGPRNSAWFTDESQRLQRALRESRPDLVIVGLGANDAWEWGTARTAEERQALKTQYQQALRNFVNIIQRSGADVLWLGPSTVDDANFERARQRIRDYQRETLGNAWADTAAMTKNIPRTDGAHFAKEGYAEWLNRLTAGPLSSLKVQRPAVSGFGELLPVFEPTYNMREVCKQLCLIEDHLNQRDKRCADCIRKHFLTIEGLIEEGIGLDKEAKHHEELQKGLDLVRGAQKCWNDGKKPEPAIAQELRTLRKDWSEKTFGMTL